MHGNGTVGLGVHTRHPLQVGVEVEHDPAGGFPRGRIGGHAQLGGQAQQGELPHPGRQRQGDRRQQALRDVGDDRDDPGRRSTWRSSGLRSVRPRWVKAAIRPSSVYMPVRVTTVPASPPVHVVLLNTRS